MDVEIKLHASFQTDSANYEVLSDGVRQVKDVPGACVEIGVRRGGGSKFIIDAMVETGQHETKPMFGIDPYGNIEYYHDEINKFHRSDYTNEMRDDTMMNMYLYCMQQKVNFMFFNMEDTEFFSRYGDGVPVYQEYKTLVNQYSFVHFDGPHTVEALNTEIGFFHSRAPKGAVFAFDDVAMYEHEYTDAALIKAGWRVLYKTERKYAYRKEIDGIQWVDSDLPPNSRSSIFEYTAPFTRNS